MTRLYCFSLVVALASDLSVSAQEKEPPKKFTNSLGMEFALVPKGKSWLGGGDGKEGMKEVIIAQDFYLGVYLVTQEEWEKVMGKNPSHFSRGGPGADAVKDIADADLKRFPVETVSWEDAKEFAKLLNEKVKKEAGWEYRLPTEEQWEYACRGGAMTDKADSAFDYYLEKVPWEGRVETLANGCAVTAQHLAGFGHIIRLGTWPGIIVSFRQLPTRPLSLLGRTGQTSPPTPLPFPGSGTGGLAHGQIWLHWLLKAAGGKETVLPPRRSCLATSGSRT